MPKLLYPQTDVASLMAEVLASPREIVTIAVEMERAGWELELHSHEKSQLFLALSGLATCEAEGGIWLVPPQAALFIPAGRTHRVAVAGKITGYAAFIKLDQAHRLPASCCTLGVTPLLRELLVRSSSFAAQHDEGGTESRVAALLMDEIAAAPADGLHLPMPSDARLRGVFENLASTPSERGTIESWAKMAGMSGRTFARSIAAETGMSFGRWRQQLHVILALQWMAGGVALKEVAANLGYENVSSFVSMFRKAVGKSPARYMAERASTG